MAQSPAPRLHPLAHVNQQSQQLSKKATGDTVKTEVSIQVQLHGGSRKSAALRAASGFPTVGRGSLNRSAPQRPAAGFPLKLLDACVFRVSAPLSHFNDGTRERISNRAPYVVEGATRIQGETRSDPSQAPPTVQSSSPSSTSLSLKVYRPDEKKSEIPSETSDLEIMTQK